MSNLTMKKLHTHCSTSVAARMLGLSTATVQKLVDKNKLSGWKTAGGHRRILTSSVESYRNASSFQSINHEKKFKIIVVTPNNKSKEIFYEILSAIDSVTECFLATSVAEMLMDIRTRNPNLVIIPAWANGVSGFEVADLIEEKMSSHDVSCIIYFESDKDLMDFKNKTPEVIRPVVTSLNTEWLRGFLSSSASRMISSMKNQM